LPGSSRQRIGDAAQRRPPALVGAVALIGAVGFSIAFLTTLDGTADGSVFGYGFFPGIVALVTWSVATSITRYRAIGRGGDVPAVREAHP
jgi:hypothetical protein